MSSIQHDARSWVELNLQGQLRRHEITPAWELERSHQISQACAPVDPTSSSTLRVIPKSMLPPLALYSVSPSLKRSIPVFRCSCCCSTLKAQSYFHMWHKAVQSLLSHHVNSPHPIYSIDSGAWKILGICINHINSNSTD